MIAYIFDDETVACLTFLPKTTCPCKNSTPQRLQSLTPFMGLIAQANDLSTCLTPNEFLS